MGRSEQTFLGKPSEVRQSKYPLVLPHVTSSVGRGRAHLWRVWLVPAVAPCPGGSQLCPFGGLKVDCARDWRHGALMIAGLSMLLEPLHRAYGGTGHPTVQSTAELLIGPPKGAPAGRGEEFCPSDPRSLNHP